MTGISTRPLDGRDIGEALATDGRGAAELASTGHAGHDLRRTQGLTGVGLDTHDELALERFNDGMHALPFRIEDPSAKTARSHLCDRAGALTLQRCQQMLGGADQRGIALELADQDRGLEKRIERLARVALRHTRLPRLAAPVGTLMDNTTGQHDDLGIEDVGKRTQARTEREAAS